jgi:hypothetical protein
MRKRIATLILLAAGGLGALAGNNTLEFVYNRFIEFFADGNPAWKADITLRADLGKPPAPPYKLHYSDSLGYYTYRPKLWTELNDYERFALRNDPRLPHFIREHALALREGQFGGVTEATNQVRLGGSPQSAGTINGAPDDSQINGLLRQEGTNTWGYRFEPGDLLNTKPLRLIELPQ